MKGEKMIILRGLLPVFIAYVIYKKPGKVANGKEIQRDLGKLYEKQIPRSVVYTALRRMIKYGIIEKQCETKSYKLNELGEIFLLKHIETLRQVNIAINKIIFDMDSNQQQ